MKKQLLTFWFICAFIGVYAQINEQVTIYLNKIVTKPNGEFTDITYPGTLLMDEVGSPLLPFITQTFVVPIDAEVTGVKINTVSKQKVNGSFYIFPAQPPIPTSLNYVPQDFQQDQLLYASAAPFPTEKVKIIFDGFDHGYHIVTVAVYPFEYIPKNKEVYACNINFSLTYSANIQQKGTSTKILKQTKRESLLIKNHIQSIVKNTSDVDSYSPQIQTVNMVKNIRSEQINLRSAQTISALDTIVPQYLIITNEELKPAFQQLADWKIKKGIPTVITTTEYIINNYRGSDISEKIRNYIIECCEKWNKSNLYVLLGGDHEIIPAKKFYSVSYEGKKTPVDLFYSTTDKVRPDKPSSLSHLGWDKENPSENLWYEVKSIQGRASVKTIAEASIFVSKVLNYEKSQINDRTYYNNILVNDAFMGPKKVTTYLNDQYKKYLKQDIHYPHNFNPWFIYDDSRCSGNPWYSYYVNYTCVVGDEELNRQNVLNALKRTPYSNPFHFIYAMDHGHVYSHGTSSKDKSESIFREDVAGLTNGNNTHIFITSSCETAQFDKDCFAESYMNNPNGGAVAYIGNADNGWTGETFQLKSFIEAINKTTTPYSIGYLFRQIQTLNGSGSYKGSNRKIMLLGDPTMEVWTDTPKEFTGTTTNASTSSVTGCTKVSVNIQNLSDNAIATICIRKGKEAYLVDDNIQSNGMYVYDVTSHTSDSIDVTVTAHNYVPYEQTLADPNNHDKNIWISDLTFDKALASNDSILSAGETIIASIKLKNTGQNAVNNLKATLKCNSNHYIHLIDSIVNFGNIQSGVTTGQFQYKFKIDPYAPEVLKNDLTPINFVLEMTDSSGNKYYDGFSIDVFTSQLKQGNKTITSTSNGNTLIEAGETVRLKIDLFNAGKATTKGLKATLSSTSPYVENISISESLINDIGYKDSQTSSEFQFKVRSNYTVNNTLLFTLKTENAFGKTETFTFDLLDRPGKVDESTIIGTGYKDEIELKWNTPLSTSPIEGYNVYRYNSDANGNPTGILQKLNAFLVPNTYFKDYGLSQFTTYHYYVTAVSESSGNESDKSNLKSVSTVIPLKYIYPVKLEPGLGTTIRTPILTYDVNNDGYKEIFTAATTDDKNLNRIGTIVGFNYNGSEFFKRGNETTNNGFADLGVAIWGGLAIGDLYGTGENQIVSITREYDGGRGQNNYITCHSLKDEEPKDFNPDILWQKHYGGGVFSSRAPVIADLNYKQDLSKDVVSSSENGDLFGFKNNGNQFWTENIGGGWTSPSLAIADLDYEEPKEIVLGAGNGIFVRLNDGSPYYSFIENENTPFYSVPGFRFDKGSVVVAELKNDGRKSIIVKATPTSSGYRYIHVIDSENGTLRSGWATNDQRADDFSNISVGDLNGDGLLEVVSVAEIGSEYFLMVWNSDGAILSKKKINNYSIKTEITPILADLDGDNEVEILLTLGNRLDAMKLNGSPVLGFPIYLTDNDEYFFSLPSVADIDNDGKNEIVAASSTYMGTCRIYVWETQGNPNRIEWGSDRHDAQNTGEYHKICGPTVIKSNTSWSSIKNICGNIIVESGTLILESDCTLNMDDSSVIIVKAGASLVIDGGLINKAGIKGLSGSSISLINDAYVKLGWRKEFNIEQGCSFINEYGFIYK